MKRIIAFVLVLILAVSAASCQKSSDADISVVMGTLSNNVYLNPFLGLKFAPGPEWSFASDKELYEQMEIDAEHMDGDEMLHELSKKKTLFGAVATDESGGNRIEFRFENLSVGGAFYDESTYADIIKEQLENAEGQNYSVAEYGKVMLAEQEYLDLTAMATSQNIEMEYHYLIRKTDNYMATVIITSVHGYGLGYEEILELFSLYR